MTREQVMAGFRRRSAETMLSANRAAKGASEQEFAAILSTLDRETHLLTQEAMRALERAKR